METMEKRWQDACAEQVHIIRPEHINGSGRLFGGQPLHVEVVKVHRVVVGIPQRVDPRVGTDARACVNGMVALAHVFTFRLCGP